MKRKYSIGAGHCCRGGILAGRREREQRCLLRAMNGVSSATLSMLEDEHELNRGEDKIGGRSVRDRSRGTETGDSYSSLCLFQFPP